MRYAKITPAAPPGQQAQPWIIADDSLRGPGSRFLIAPTDTGFQQATDSIAYLFGNFTRNLSLGNREVAFSLYVDMEFADQNACFLFLTRLPLDCPPTGLLEIGVVNGAAISYPNAVVQAAKFVSTGSDPTVVSAKVRYDILAGAPGGAT